MSEKILELKNINAAYGEIKILHDVSMFVGEGEIVALMGPNGAGKSTVLKVIFGMLPHTGSVCFQDEKIILSPDVLIRKGIVFVPQGRRVFNNLTVEENLEIGGFALNDEMECKRRVAELFHMFPVLHSRRGEYAGALSGGQQQLLSIARGLMMKPKLLLLDEPTIGLSPKVVKEIFSTIKKINKESGTSILVVEHNLHSLLPITDRAYVLNHGRIVAVDTGVNIGQSDILERVFMGKL